MYIKFAILKRKEVRKFNFLEKFKSNNIDPNLISFEPEYTMFGESGGVSIWMRYNGKVVGIFSMPYNSSKHFFESHSHVYENYKGKGIGLLLYIIGAKVAHENYDARLYMSRSPSHDAKKIWEWAYKNGWAKKQIYGRTQFLRRVLDQNFNDIYLFFQEHSTKDLPNLEEFVNTANYRGPVSNSR